VAGAQSGETQNEPQERLFLRLIIGAESCRPVFGVQVKRYLYIGPCIEKHSSHSLIQPANQSMGEGIYHFPAKGQHTL